MVDQTKSCISAADQSIPTSLLQGALRPKISDYSLHSTQSVNIHLVAGLRFIAGLTRGGWIFWRQFNLLLPTQWLEVNGGPVNPG